MRVLIIVLFAMIFLVGCKITSFEQCVAQGGVVKESSPRQCSLGGNSFFEVVKPGVSCVDKCGDGICQEVVCHSTDCICSESKTICPFDCK